MRWFGGVPSARELRDAAISMAFAAASPEWTARAKEIVYAVALVKPEFTTDDVWEWGLAEPREGRALGPIMLWAAQLGIVEKTGRYVPMRRRQRHVAPVAVWRSRIFATTIDAKVIE